MSVSSTPSYPHRIRARNMTRWQQRGGEGSTPLHMLTGFRHDVAVSGGSNLDRQSSVAVEDVGPSAHCPWRGLGRRIVPTPLGRRSESLRRRLRTGVHSISANPRTVPPGTPLSGWNDLYVLHAVQREWCPHPEIGRYRDVHSLREGHNNYDFLELYGEKPYITLRERRALTDVCDD